METVLYTVQKIAARIAMIRDGLTWRFTRPSKKKAAMTRIMAPLEIFPETKSLLSRALSSGLRIRARALGDGVRGYYDPQANRITINVSLLDHPLLSARTLVHELRHWQQFADGKIGARHFSDIRYDLMYMHAIESDAAAFDTVFAEALAKTDATGGGKIFTAEALSRHFNDNLRHMGFYDAMTGADYYRRYSRSGAHVAPSGMDMAAIDRLHGMLVSGVSADDPVYFMPDAPRARFAFALLSSFNSAVRGVIVNPLRRFEKDVRPRTRATRKDVKNLARRASAAKDSVIRFD